jgi:hypothetical protein
VVRGYLLGGARCYRRDGGWSSHCDGTLWLRWESESNAIPLRWCVRWGSRCSHWEPGRRAR